MGRLSVLIFIAIILPLGFVVGFFLRGFTNPAVVPTNTSALHPPAVTAEEKAGWCCPDTGRTCEASESAVACLSTVGRMFHKDQRTCNTACELTAQ